MTMTHARPLPISPLDEPDGWDPADVVAVRRRPRRAAVGIALIVAAAFGVGMGHATYDATHGPTPLSRGQVADAARWQGQADAYEERLDVARGRATDAARWQAQADAYLATTTSTLRSEEGR